MLALPKQISFCSLVFTLILGLFTSVPLSPAYSQTTNCDSAPTPGGAVRPRTLPFPEVRYEFRQPHDPDGIGKFYMGREIVHVMGHQGAAWLERPERISEEAPELLVSKLRIPAGAVVADIGAGTGYFTRRLAQQVGPGGRVFAVDVQPEMLALLTNSASKLGLTNIIPVLGTENDPKLPPASVDLVLMVDVYHEFEFPYEMMEAICRALKPGARVALVEYRAEDPAVPIKPLHKMTEAQVKKEMSVLPLEWVETLEPLPRQHLIVFRKPATNSAPEEIISRQPRSER